MVVELVELLVFASVDMKAASWERKTVVSTAEKMENWKAENLVV